MGVSRASSITKTSIERGRSEYVLAPKDYFLGPVFAATKQTGRREVTIGDKHYLIGGFHPLRANFFPPALDVRHARAIFTLLSFRDSTEDPSNQVIRFAFNEFCRRYANSSGGRYMRDIKNILGEIVDSFIQVTDLNTKVAHSYRIIERVEIRAPAIKRKDSKMANSPQLELGLNSCTLSPEFCRLLGDIVELRHLKLSVFTSIRSPLAQAIYLYIPSRAYHHTEERPFEIALSKLYEQVSFPTPTCKSKRKEILTQHSDEKRSILQQLDGVETLTGRFRVQLTETSNGYDWKLLCWEEKPQRGYVLGESIMEAAYLNSGRTLQQLQAALKNIKPLSEYELELLNKAKIEVASNRRFFEKAKALMKPHEFTGLLSEAKADELEGRRAWKNPTARLIHRLKDAISAPIKDI